MLYLTSGILSRFTPIQHPLFPKCYHSWLPFPLSHSHSPLLCCPLLSQSDESIQSCLLPPSLPAPSLLSLYLSPSLSPSLNPLRVVFYLLSLLSLSQIRPRSPSLSLVSLSISLCASDPDRHSSLSLSTSSDFFQLLFTICTLFICHTFLTSQPNSKFDRYSFLQYFSIRTILIPNRLWLVCNSYTSLVF